MTEFQITNPEPFILGSGQQKYPGGYIARVLLNGQTMFETLESTPKFCQQACLWYCITYKPEEQKPPEPIIEKTEPTPIIVATTESVSAQI